MAPSGSLLPRVLRIINNNNNNNNYYYYNNNIQISISPSMCSAALPVSSAYTCTMTLQYKLFYRN